MEQVFGTKWNQNFLSVSLVFDFFLNIVFFSLSQHTGFLHGVENMAEFYTLHF